MASPSGGSQTKTWPTEVVAAIEAPVVCRGCNGGRMCGPDGQVKHLLQPMMLGQLRTLSPQEQSTIATWAAMKSMVLEYVWGAEQVIVQPQAARTFVFRQQHPPGNMQIRIAAVESQGRPALIYRRVYQLQPEHAKGAALPEFASCSTFVLGCFVIQTFGTSTAPTPHGSTYFVVDPPTGTSISWPPPEPLDDAALDQFAHPLQPVTGD